MPDGNRSRSVAGTGHSGAPWRCSAGRRSGTTVTYPQWPLRWVLIRHPQETFETQALLCTDLDADPERIISWFVRRWQMESTFQEVRQRLGFETQRHWSDKAIERTAPAMLALFSLLTLFAHRYMAGSADIARRTGPGMVNAPRSSPMLWRWLGRSCGHRKRLFVGRSRRPRR
jgi:hypothetical protein